MTPRSLVGMTMGARKRRWARDFNAIPQLERASVAVSMLAAYGVFPKHGNSLGQRLRPCPGKHGCVNCTRTCGACEDQIPDDKRCLQCGEVMTTEGPFCDGSGVIPAKARKVRR
jgi:hypothetical protein